MVVVSHNMGRELPRTLFSLSAAFQRRIAREDYEVVVVDNGSMVPPSERDFPGLDLNLRCLRMEVPTSSPVPAINRGLGEARGRWIGAWIDGARMASPGLLAMTREALGAAPRAVVGARARHLGNGLQADTMLRGYSQTAEDHLLDDIGWRSDGYRLFDVSVLEESTGPTWFDPISESNSLFLSRAMWDELGGYEDRFRSAGGGMANLDIWTRAISLPGAVPIVLLGEATFHQFHGGTMTNAPNQMAKWQMLCQEYESIRGVPWRLPEAPLRFWGTFTHKPPAGELVCRFRGLRASVRRVLRRALRVWKFGPGSMG